jgi:hypothetical protein
MKMGDLLDIHAEAKHIEDHAKTLQRLMDKRLKDRNSINWKMWKRDMDVTVERMEEELKGLKELLAKDEGFSEKETPTEK